MFVEALERDAMSGGTEGDTNTHDFHMFLHAVSSLVGAAGPASRGTSPDPSLTRVWRPASPADPPTPQGPSTGPPHTPSPGVAPEVWIWGTLPVVARNDPGLVL